MFQISGRDVVFEWLSRQTDSERRRAMLDWLVDFSQEPLANAQRVPGIRAPIFIAVVPLPLDAAVVRFLYAEQFRTVRILAIKPLI